MVKILGVLDIINKIGVPFVQGNIVGIIPFVFPLQAEVPISR